MPHQNARYPSTAPFSHHNQYNEIVAFPIADCSKSGAGACELSYPAVARIESGYGPASASTRVQPEKILPGPSAPARNPSPFLVVIAALYFGRDVFVPLVLAGLLSFALAPLVAALRRRGIPRTPAVIAVVILAFLGIFVFGFVVAGQVSQLGASLPRYEYNIREKVRSLQSNAPGGGLIERAAEVLRDLRKDIEDATEPPRRAGDVAARAGSRRAGADTGSNQAARPCAAANAADNRRALIEPLATTGIVIVFVVFMLLQREDLRDRFIRLVGTSDLHRTTQALGEAASGSAAIC